MSQTTDTTPAAPDSAGTVARSSRLVPLIAAAVGMLLYAVTLGGTWVYDDVYHLFNDERTQVPEARPGAPPPPHRPAIEDPAQWGRYLTESYNDGIDNLYRPITSVSFALQATMHGRGERTAWLWHLVNVLLYGVVCAQVAMLAERLARGRESGSLSSGNPTLRVAQVRLGETSSSGTLRGANGAGRVDCAGWAAMGAGMLFATHPVHVEVVAGIVGRAELICAAGFLGGLLVLTRPLTPARIAAFVALMLLSIGGKEQGLVLPAAALAWYLARRYAGLASLARRTPPADEGPFTISATAAGADTKDPAGSAAAASSHPLAYQPSRSRRDSDGLGKAFFIAVALPLAAYLIVREQVLGLSMAWPRELLDPSIQTMRDVAGLDRWLMPVALAGRYLHLLIWPHRLAIDYGAVVIVPPQRFDDPYLWLGALAVLLYAAALVHALRARWAAGLTLLAGFGLTYGLIANFATIIGTVFGERLLFLPSAFFVIYLVLLAARGWPDRRWWIAAALALAALGAARSLTYAIRWNDRGAFYAYQTRVQPKSVRTWMLLGEELRQRGRLAEAAEAAARATALDPNYWDSWILRAYVATDAGELEAALEYAERAVQARTSVTTTNVRARIERLLHAQRQAATRPTTAAATTSPSDAAPAAQTLPSSTSSPPPRR